MKVLIFVLLVSLNLNAKEISLSFDDAPHSGSTHFTSHERTKTLIKKLKANNVPSVMIFANPCRRKDTNNTVAQLKLYKDAGHLIGNHTCTHPRYDKVGFEVYSTDALKADKLLAPLMTGQKFFRFPYLNEGKEEKLRDQMREWLKANNYRNGYVTLDNDDYQFSSKINEAKKQNKPVDYQKVEALFIEHVLGAANFYDNLAVKTLGRSPKHNILLHEMDVTVMFMDSLIRALRDDGWKIISAEEAFQDKIYLEQPKNTYANNGLISQIHMEKTGEKVAYDVFDDISKKLDQVLGLE